MIKQPLLVIGAGSWGTALAILLARNGQSVHLWGIDTFQLQQMQNERCNRFYLPAIPFPDNLHVFQALPSAINGVQDILIAVPSHGFRDTLHSIAPFITSQTRLLWATKGLDPKSNKLLHWVVQEELGSIPMAVLSGPSFALEVARGLPTAVTLASIDPAFTQAMIACLHNATFRIYSNQDMVGVQVGGVVKNVLAVASGIADGLGFGANTRAALLTRGLAEMQRLALALGGESKTIMGLAGLGDLILTGTDNQSRNRRFGMAIGKGANVQDAQASIGQVVESVKNTAEVCQLARQHHVEMPICEQVYQVLHQGLSPEIAVANLLSREPKSE